MLFALAAGIAGFGGVMLGMTNGFVSNTSATPITGLLWLAVVVTFGIRRPGGALLGGLAVMATTPIFQWISGFSFMPSWFNDLTASTYFASIMFGLGAINLAKNPDGLFALIGDQRAERRRKRERAAHIELAEEQLHAVARPNGSGAPSGATQAKVPVVSVATDVTLPEPAALPLVTDADAGLTIDEVVAGYDDVEVLHGVSLRTRAWERRRARRRERRREVDAVRDDRGSRRPVPGPDPRRGARRHGARLVRTGTRRRDAGARGARHLSRAHR